MASSRLAGNGLQVPLAARRPTLPVPDESGIEHVVVVMMENRSFDHMLGWMPRADGKQAGLAYLDKNGRSVATHHLTDFQGCAWHDPDHSYEGGRVQFNRGRCDGFLRSGDNDEFAVGYYERADLPFFAEAALAWTTFDRYFCPFLGPTYPNRMYQHAGATDRIENSSDTSLLPTIWDRLADKGLSGTYYFHDLPVTALWGTKYIPISRRYEQFQLDAASGRLPNVAFIDPRFLDEGDGTSNDDHPHADMRAGEMFLNDLYNTVVSSPAWDKTVLIVNFDEWGGFYDHVRPPAARDEHESRKLTDNWGQRGFRTPTLLMSPLARRGFVSHRVYDHTSILKMIEWRWGLEPLTVRDATANNIAAALDFEAGPNPDAPSFDVPAFPIGESCSIDELPTDQREESYWTGLRAKALADGWGL